MGFFVVGMGRQLRRILADHKDLERKPVALEKKYDEEFKVVFDAIRELMTPPEKPTRKIGFDIKERRASYGKGTKKKKKKV